MENKKTVRASFIQTRAALSKEDIENNSKIIIERVLNSDIYKGADKIFTYVNIRSEVKTIPIIEKALSDKKMVAVPYMTDEKRIMNFIDIDSIDSLVKNKIGIPEPIFEKSKIVYPDENTLFIVPLVAFDNCKNRMGYGGGYYDTYFQEYSFGKRLGLAFELQRAEKIPTEPNDIKMDFIITEKDCY